MNRVKQRTALTGFLLLGTSPTVAQDAGADPTLRIIYKGTTSATSDKNLTVDIFWCSGDDKAGDRALLASELAGSYATLAKVSSQVSPYVWQIRTRPIDKDKFVGALQPDEVKIARTQPVLDVSSTDQIAQKVATEFVSAGINTASIWNQEKSFSRGYLAAYTCQDIDTAKYSGHLYFQVKDPSQKVTAAKAAADINAIFPGLSVAKGIEVVGDRSPASSELRFFAEADRATANTVADEIQRTTGDKLQTKFVTGYEGKVKSGTFEAWIAGGPVP